MQVWTAGDTKIESARVLGCETAEGASMRGMRDYYECEEAESAGVQDCGCGCG